MKASAVPAVAARQAGAFTGVQAGAEGFSPRQVRRRLESGTWVRVAGQGLAAADAERTAPLVAWAVHLTLPGAVVSHGTAAALHGFPRTGPIEACAVVAPGSGRSRSIRTRRGVVGPAERTLMDGAVPVTARARTAVDCLADLPREAALSLLAWVVTRRVIEPAQLRLALPGHRGRPGFEQLRYLSELSARGALSVAEACCHDVLDRHGITGWTANVTITDGSGIIAVADLLFEAERVIIEVDGWGSHRSRESFVKDRQRQARLVAAGYVVLPVTWHDLTRDGGRAFAGQLRRVLAERRRAA
jgi:hypothetical protein